MPQPSVSFCLCGPSTEGWLWLEASPAPAPGLLPLCPARGARGGPRPLTARFSMVSAGEWEPGGLRSGHLADIQQKFLHFLESLKVCPPLSCPADDSCVPLGLFCFG